MNGATKAIHAGDMIMRDTGIDAKDELLGNGGNISTYMAGGQASKPQAGPPLGRDLPALVVGIRL
jgi:hypothetical protein